MTQNTWRRGLALGNAPDARILRWRYQHVGIFWCYLTLKFTLAPTQNLKFALAPTQNPDASQWNISGVGSSGVGHVYFMYISCIFHVVCASFSALATRRKGSFQCNMGLKPIFHCDVKPLASGPCIGLHPQCDDFVLPIIIRRPASALLDKLLCLPGPGGPAAAG